VPYIAATPKPPYYAVIFTSVNAPVDHAEHTALSAKLVEHAKTFSGFLGIEGSRNSDGTGVTAVYWKDRESIQAWAKDPMHQAAKVKGRELWYSHWMIRICMVEREYGRPDHKA
jgi:heme-degrading monooxygenase HmoA